MHNKKINQLLIGAMLAAMAPAVSAADIPAWNGSALGFEAGQQGLLGDMLGIRPILEENGFHYNLGYLKEGANKRGNSSRLTQSFHFFMFEPIFSPVNALNQPI